MSMPPVPDRTVSAYWLSRWAKGDGKVRIEIAILLLIVVCNYDLLSLKHHIHFLLFLNHYYQVDPFRVWGC